MTDAKFKVSYPAAAQLALLPRAERVALRQLFAGTEIEQSATTQSIGDDRFVSRLGSKRVLWRKSSPRMKPEILSIVDQSFTEAG